MTSIELNSILPGSVVEVTRRFMLQIGFNRHHHPSKGPADQLDAAEEVACHRFSDAGLSLVKVFQKLNKKMGRRQRLPRCDGERAKMNGRVGAIAKGFNQR